MNQIKSILLGVVMTLIAVGAAYYLLPKPNSVENPLSVYTDDYLSFKYPENVQLLFDKPFGGRQDSQGIEFLVYSPEMDTYQSTGLRLSYMVSLGESESADFANLDEIESFYQPYDLETHMFDVDDRQALQVVTGDMTGETFFISIPAEQDGNAYRFNGSFINDTIEEVLRMFMESADLKR